MIEATYLKSVIQQFTQCKTMAEKAMLQVPDDKLTWQYHSESNNLVIIVKHMAGNMLSRFSEFLTSDGEKPGRNREAEFETEILTRIQLLAVWNRGWDCLFHTLSGLRPEDLSKTITIRGEEHTVVEAINRQLVHHAGHAGQIVFISKMIAGAQWKSITIPRVI